MVQRVLRFGYRFSESREGARDWDASSAQARWLSSTRESSLPTTQIVKENKDLKTGRSVKVYHLI